MVESKSQIKRMAIQRGDHICASCGKAFSGDPHGVHLFSGAYDDGPYCEDCASDMQTNEDKIIGEG